MQIEFTAFRNKPVMLNEETDHLLENSAGSLSEEAKVINLASYHYKRAIISRNEAIEKMKSRGWIKQFINWFSDLFSFKK